MCRAFFSLPEEAWTTSKPGVADRLRTPTHLAHLQAGDQATLWKLRDAQSGRFRSLPRAKYPRRFGEHTSFES